MIEDTSENLAAMRREYGTAGLAESDLAPTWWEQFGRWLAEATAGGIVEPNAMVLATAAPDGRPSARSVLLKSYDADGFTFYTNYDSRKSGELAENPAASLVFPWYPVSRQVLVTGDVERVSRAESEEYFAVRPRGAQLGAWASHQSEVLADRAELEAAWAAAEARYPGEVPIPPHWGGYRIRPDSVEFWQGRQSRLHDRLRFRHSAAGWAVERLAP